MKFTLDTEAKTIELLSSVTIKELIELNNTIKDFDSYTVKGKINEVQTQLDKPRQKFNDDIYNEYIEKIKQEKMKKVRDFNPIVYPKIDPQKPYKLNDNIDAYNKYYKTGLIAESLDQKVEWNTNLDDYLAYTKENGKDNNNENLFIMGIYPYRTETVNTEM